MDKKDTSLSCLRNTYDNMNIITNHAESFTHSTPVVNVTGGDNADSAFEANNCWRKSALFTHSFEDWYI